MFRTPYAIPGVPAPYLFIVFILIAPVALCLNPANNVVAILIISISMPVTPRCFVCEGQKYIKKQHCNYNNLNDVYMSD